MSEDELVDAVWGGKAIADTTLASRVHAARRALGDQCGDQRYIRTAHRRGCRIVGHVEDAPQAPPPPAPALSVAAAGTTLFVAARDGTRGAAATTGEGFPVVRVGAWPTHTRTMRPTPVGGR